MATIAATGGSREARRRRIVERGADRLALITGRIQSLPPDPNPDQSPYAACPPGQVPADGYQHENVDSNKQLSDDEPGGEPSQRHILLDETKEPLLENIDNGEAVSSRPVASLGVESEEQSQILSPPMQIERTLGNSFTTGRISKAIASSENIRTYCSVAAAILVIFSYIEFPILGCRLVRSVLISKPLFLLLLTNISIVLVLGIHGPELRTGHTSSVPKFSGKLLVDQMGKALESGLLLQKILEAMFIDFGIYAVVLVCGLSLVRILGW
ncbi:hypothetical protein OROHE_009283 [Orobanche hederae]